MDAEGEKRGALDALGRVLCTAACLLCTRAPRFGDVALTPQNGGTKYYRPWVYQPVGAVKKLRQEKAR